MLHFKFFYFEKSGLVENGAVQGLYVCYGSNLGMVNSKKSRIVCLLLCILLHDIKSQRAKNI
jgi:hypothetical protein